MKYNYLRWTLLASLLSLNLLVSGIPTPQDETDRPRLSTTSTFTLAPTQTSNTHRAAARVTPVNQANPSTVVGLFRKCAFTGRDVPVMTFGNPALSDSNIPPYFVAVNFGDTRGVVHGTFDYIDDGAKCQFTSMDGTQVARGLQSGSVHDFLTFPGIECPPLDARTVRYQLDLFNHQTPLWTLSSNGAWITTAFPSTRTVTLTTRFTTPSATPTWTQRISYNSTETLHLVIYSVLGALIAVCACVVVFSKAGQRKPHMGHSVPSAPPSSSSGTRAAQTQVTTNGSRRDARHASGMPARPFSSHAAQVFLQTYPSNQFPMDSSTLSSMQLSPAQWHFVNPTYALESECTYQRLLSPNMSFDPDNATFSLFSDPRKSSHKDHPQALAVQTRLPVPVPPADARSSDSPYAGIRVPPTVYFELRLVRMASPSTAVAIGLAISPYPPFALPGDHKWSIAYHSTAGDLHMSPGSPQRKYGPAFGQGDVVGVGINTLARCVFFTRNGKRLPMAVELPTGKDAVYPTVGATGACEVEYNFGIKAFRWDGREEESGHVQARNGQAEEEVEFMGYVMDALPMYEG